MKTLKTIQNLIDNTNNAIYGLYDKYPTISEMVNSEEYKILMAKLEAYDEVSKIVRNDLRELRNMISEMADF